MDEKLFEFNILKNAPKFSRFFYIPLMTAFLLACIIGAVFILINTVFMNEFWVVVICILPFFLIATVPFYYLLATIHSTLTVYKNRLEYINWRRKKIMINIKSEDLFFLPLGQYGIWIKDRDQKVILKIYGLQWSVFFEKSFCKSGLKRIS